MFDFLPVLLEDSKQRVSTVHTEAIEVEKYEQQICLLHFYCRVCGPGLISNWKMNYLVATQRQ
jgi:hypothetical protein